MKNITCLTIIFSLFSCQANAQMIAEINKQDAENLKVFICTNLDRQVYTYGQIQKIVKEEILYSTRYTRKINSYTSNLGSDSFALSMIQNTENQLAESSSFQLMNEAIKTKCVRHSHYLR
jgi:hypothetical protein